MLGAVETPEGQTLDREKGATTGGQYISFSPSENALWVNKAFSGGEKENNQSFTANKSKEALLARMLFSILMEDLVNYCITSMCIPAPTDI